jgi:hypothetical protein
MAEVAMTEAMAAVKKVLEMVVVMMAEAATVAVAQEVAGKAEVTAGEVVAEKWRRATVVVCLVDGGEKR